MPPCRSYKDNPGHISRKNLPLRFLLSAWSLAAGLSVTGRFFLKPWHTVRYPFKVLPNIDSYRGHIEHIGLPENPAWPRCISCMLCARACPSGCIAITPRRKGTGANLEDEGRRDPLNFILDFSKCSLCGLCVESCPVDSLKFSHNIYTVWSSRKEFHIDLLRRLAERGREA